VVVVFIEHGGHGSTAAAPVAREVYEAYFRDRLRAPSVAP
jgi:cell division protein FtsI/penicillin-binding protein 2